jgi:Flp pilus assembly pilin Flp
MNRLLNRFLREERAAVAFESVIIFPILVWAWVGTFTFFDAYRVYNTSIKATFTVADLISRQEFDIQVDEMDGFANMLASMIRDHDGVQMRATEIHRTNDGSYRAVWSHTTGNLARLCGNSLASMQDRLPTVAIGERFVILESFIDFEPAFNMGVNDLDFENFTVTRPRYAGRVPYAGEQCPFTGSTTTS